MLLVVAAYQWTAFLKFFISFWKYEKWINFEEFPKFDHFCTFWFLTLSSLYRTLDKLPQIFWGAQILNA